MKRLQFPIILVPILACLALLMIPCSLFFGSIPESKLTVSETVFPQSPYLLSSSGDHLILYTESDSETPIIYPIDPRTLPPYDQMLLKQGIPIADSASLNQLLEDYGS